MTSFGTPPNLIVHASGIPKSNDYLKNGIPLVIFSIILLMLAEHYYWDIARGWVGLST